MANNSIQNSAIFETKTVLADADELYLQIQPEDNCDNSYVQLVVNDKQSGVIEAVRKSSAIGQMSCLNEAVRKSSAIGQMSCLNEAVRKSSAIDQMSCLNEASANRLQLVKCRA